MEMPCISCGDCERACPAGLRPQRLLRALAVDASRLVQAEGLGDCSGCGACDLACPSRIQLSARFVAAKHQLQARTRLLAAAAEARARFEARGLRLQREAAERSARNAELQQELGASDAVAAAIARAQAKRRPPPGTP